MKEAFQENTFIGRAIIHTSCCLRIIYKKCSCILRIKKKYFIHKGNL